LFRCTAGTFASPPEPVVAEYLSILRA
jgi:hypothetical protein